MITTKKSQKALKRKNLFCNFLNMNLELGDVLVMDKKDHTKFGNIESFISGLNLKDLIEKGPEMNLNFQSESKIGIEFSGKIKGNVLNEDEVYLKFNSNKTTFINLLGVKHWELPIGLIEERLKELWKDKEWNDGSKKRNFHLVTSVLHAESGLLIYSKDSNNIIKLKSSSGVPLLGNSDVAAADLDIGSSTKSLIQIKSTEPFTPIYGAKRMNAKGDFVTVC